MASAVTDLVLVLSQLQAPPKLEATRPPKILHPLLLLPQLRLLEKSLPPSQSIFTAEVITLPVFILDIRFILSP